jgi:hypothetical protein
MSATQALPQPLRAVLKPIRDAGRAALRRIYARVFAYTLPRLETATVVPMLEAHNLNVARVSDFYSPLPVARTVRRNLTRWFKPSGLVGVPYDLGEMKTTLRDLVGQFGPEYLGLPAYMLHDAQRFGRGYTQLDAMLLYMMIRALRPRRYIEVGSGLSTYYASLAAGKNAGEGHPLRMSCIDPYPYEKVDTIAGVDVLRMEVQDVDLAYFAELGAGDVLFIDSTHVLKLDGDVAFLFLEVLPRLQQGVHVHVHDVHFPYNVPYPPEYYLFRQWPLFRTEAMILQAFLAFNTAFRIRMSMPMLRFFDEEFLRAIVPAYEPTRVDEPTTHYGAAWLEKIQ